MSGPLTRRSPCLHPDPFPLSLDLSMMIQSITSVIFSPGNIQPSSLHRIANGLSHALHSTTHLRSTSNVWQIGHTAAQGSFMAPNSNSEASFRDHSNTWVGVRHARITEQRGWVAAHARI